MIAAEAATPIWAQAGVFAVVLVVAFWLLKRSDEREQRAADAARKDIAAVQAELAEIRHELTECHRERSKQAQRIAALEARNN